MIEGIYILLSLVIFLVIVSAFLSASEVIYSSSREEVMRTMSKDEPLYEVLAHPEKFFPVILVLDNLSNIVITAIITYKTIEIFGGTGVPISTAVVSIVVILFGEILPKTLSAKYRGELSRLILILSAYLVKIFGFISSPISKVFDKIAQEEIKRHAHLDRISLEQIKMIKGIAKLKDLELRDILVPKHLSVVLNTEMSMSEVISVINKTKHTRYPVMSDKRVIGILLSKNLLCNFYDYIKKTDGSSNEDIKLKDVLNVNPEIMRQPRFASPSKSVLEQLIDFKKWKTHIVCVIDDFGEFLGIVTLEDIIEEITGEVQDEFVTPTRNFWRDGEYIYARGSTPIRDINRELETDIDEKLETIASTVISILGRIPEKGEKINFDGWEIEFIDVTKDKINLVRMKKSL